MDHLIQTDTSLKAAVSKVLKTSSCRLFSLRVVSLSSTLLYFQLFNRTTVPTNSTVPTTSDILYADQGYGGGCLILDVDHFGNSGMLFSTGLTWGLSTTPEVYTANAAPDAIVTVRFV